MIPTTSVRAGFVSIRPGLRRERFSLTTSADGPALELGEGFSHDDVVVLVDGSPIWHSSDVSTNYSVGLADRVRLPISGVDTAIVEVRARGSVGTAQVGAAPDGDGSVLRAVIDPDGTLHLGPGHSGVVF